MQGNQRDSLVWYIIDAYLVRGLAIIYSFCQPVIKPGG